jgi:hypothetical protein
MGQTEYGIIEEIAIRDGYEFIDEYRGNQMLKIKLVPDGKSQRNYIRNLMEKSGLIAYVNPIAKVEKFGDRGTYDGHHLYTYKMIQTVDPVRYIITGLPGPIRIQKKDNW